MKISKIIVAILIFVMMFMTVTAFARPTDMINENNLDGSKYVKPNTIESVLGENAGKTVEIDNGVAGNILGAMQWIGYAIAVGMLMYIGIKYVMSAADERANLKGSLVKYVMGAVLIASAVTIVGWIWNMG